MTLTRQSKFKYGPVNHVFEGGRILSHGQVTSLATAFSRPEYFSIYIRPKIAVTVQDILVEVKCGQEGDFSPAPFLFYQWSPLALKEIKAGALDLASYDIYWGAGASIEEF